MAGPPTASGERVVVLNPESGTGDHRPTVTMLADEHGFAVHESGAPGEAIELAARAAETASLVAAAGGDGTVNEVVRGLRRAGALGDTALGVVPAGTGNNFADKIGVRDVDHAFEVLVGGETRRIDLGLAVTPDAERAMAVDEPTDAGSLASEPPASTGDPATDDGTRPFVNSCVCGITAEASASTSHDQKDRLGTLAYVVNTLQEVAAFDPVQLRVETGGDALLSAGAESDGHADGGTAWAGEAVAVLVGNARRFPAEGSTQADVEDGLMDVTIVEDRPALDLVGEEARRRLLDAEGEHLTRLQTASLTLSVADGEPLTFSLDGEVLETDRLELSVEPRSLDVRVGEAYEPSPDA